MNLRRITAIAFALRGKHACGGRNHHYSFILKKSKILSIGMNDYLKTHPKIKEFGYSPHSGIHSELSACLKLGLEDCSGLTIVNVRINNNLELANSKPCKACARMIATLGFDNVVYTNEFGKYVEQC